MQLKDDHNAKIAQRLIIDRRQNNRQINGSQVELYNDNLPRCDHLKNEWEQIEHAIDQINDLEYFIADMELKNYGSIRLVTVGYSKEQIKANQQEREKLKQLRQAKSDLLEMI